MAIHPLQSFGLVVATTQALTCWMPAIPLDLLNRVREHLRIEGGTATVAFEFNVRDGKALTCAVRVDGHRRTILGGQ